MEKKFVNFQFEKRLEKVIGELSEEELASTVCLLANKLYAVNKGTSKESISAVMRWTPKFGPEVKL